MRHLTELFKVRFTSRVWAWGGCGRKILYWYIAVA